ncbi:MAG: RNA polymerase sigma factor [Candidatus Limnocylindria bacterium]
MDDRALIDAVLAGDRQAFSAFVERETTSVFRACLRILGRPHEAQDVTQEAFILAYRALGSYRGEGALRGWLLRIATRQALRRRSQRRPTEPIDSVPEARLGDASHDPARATLDAERRETLLGAVHRLPNPYREVVALRFFAELTLAEIADATGRPLNTVKTHLRRGLERLRTTVAPEGLDR